MLQVPGRISNGSPAYSQSAAPRLYPTQAVNQHFGDVYNAQAQEAGVALGRDTSKAAAEYSLNAQQARNQHSLSALSLLNTQQQNAWQRQNAQQQMAYGLMNDIVGGYTGLLKGLL